MIYKEPLNISVILSLIEQVVDNTSEYLLKAQQYDKEYKFDVVELEELKKIIDKYKKQKLLYANEINGSVYYNYEDCLTFNMDKSCNVYDIIEIALAVLLTQNRAIIYMSKLNKSSGLDLVINILKKFDSTLKIYDNYLEFKLLPKKEMKYNYNLIRKDNKLIQKRKSLEIEFDFNLLLKAYK